MAENYRRGICCHETGHAVVLHSFGIGVVAVYVIFTEEKGWHGGTNIIPGSDAQLHFMGQRRRSDLKWIIGQWHAGRKTGGRQKGARNRATAEARAAAEATGVMPLDYMLTIMRDPTTEKLGRLRRGRARCRSRFQGTLNRRRKGRISGGRGRQPCTRAKDWSARSRS